MLISTTGDSRRWTKEPELFLGVDNGFLVDFVMIGSSSLDGSFWI